MTMRHVYAPTETLKILVSIESRSEGVDLVTGPEAEF